MSKDNGGPAFPVPATEYHGMDEGMTLRDYFAAKAMTAFITGAMADGIHLNLNGGDANTAAEAGYIIADAMLKEREKS
ncbi:hypothetical protein RE075_002176 [Klebsiella aerogenes]|uniref:hypothetical protein n=1 Tax=Klebsiella aerogenes TaxID=548 RepID=UPI00063C5439|nr:hypothetical protein [Klebsiella aerogenes]EKZ6391735.1 hypothetical protein [Klebsiella aerogenes]KLF54052.1 hypothetical protein YA36_17920 [Klebsiella aerogenes]